MSDRETRKANVVEALNKARSMELHAIHQYMNQHYNLDDMLPQTVQTPSLNV